MIEEAVAKHQDSYGDPSALEYMTKVVMGEEEKEEEHNMSRFNN